jgi:predicted ATP-dependent endonuclease of OLD family
MKLISVTIDKFKCIESAQTFDVNDGITILVGMNESGKTSVLESVAKTRYFQEDENFKFNLVYDYPRKWKKNVDKSGENPVAVVCTYELEDEDVARIENDLGKNVVTSRRITRTVRYDNSVTISMIEIDKKRVIENSLKKANAFSDSLCEKLEKVNSSQELSNVISDYSDETKIEGIKTLQKFFKSPNDKWGSQFEWYVYNKFISPFFPKFLYYDEYYALPSRISLEKINNNTSGISEEEKTAKALIELADIDVQELVHSTNFESFKAELEATQENISDVLFKYWKTNKNLRIAFDIDKVEETNRNGTQIVEHVLDIRVRNKGVSLPLKNRSKGFNWFFSFLVWFKKIQEDKNSKYILLLDEPGLNLHASAQKDLLEFIEDLSKDYQIIYTTHSPFMIPSDHLDRVRTVLETDKGSIISNSIQEKDPNTLFPLQAALGYDIAQNLFISPKNLLVEGVSDLMYLQVMSNVLLSLGREGLKEDITIVPVGGLDKVATFISLLRGQELQIACLLDTFTDAKGKAKVEDLIVGKIIQKNKIKFFDEFVDDYKQADIEDMFTKNDYLKIYNAANKKDVKVSDLKGSIKPIIIQLNDFLGVSRFNHYTPANTLVQMGVSSDYFDPQTLDNFENVFKTINKLFQ